MESVKNIYLFDDIDTNTYGQVIKPLLENKEAYSTILFFINSYGGDVDVGYCLIEFLKLLKKKIITVNVGACYSMAQVVYLCGDIRLSIPSAKFMIHETSFYNTSPKKIASLEKEIKETIQMDEKINNYIIERTNFTKSELKNILVSKEDYYYSSKQAILNGTTHRVIKSLNYKNLIKNFPKSN